VSGPISCRRCGRRVTNPYEQYAERIEYRRLDCKDRPLSRTLRLLCRDCVDAIRVEMDGAPLAQLDLFGQGDMT